MAVNILPSVLITLAAAGVLFWLAFRLRLRWQPAFWLRIGLLLMVLITIQIAMAQGGSGEVYPVEVLLVDQSVSVDASQAEIVQSFALAWKEAQPNRHVVVFGQNVEVVLSQQWPEIDGLGSDLAGGLSEAVQLFGETPGRVVVVTDGAVGDISGVYVQIDDLERQGYTVDYLALPEVVYPNDVYVDEVNTPKTVWEGENFSIKVKVFSPVSVTGQLQVYANGDLIYDEPVNLNANDIQSIEGIRYEAGTSGILLIQAVVLVDGDGFVGNNAGHGSVEIVKSPDILLVTKNRGVVGDLVNDIQTENGKVTLVSPNDFPTSLDALEPYEVVLVHDLLAQDLSIEQMQALNIHITEKGRSLIFLGGRNSFTLGGYQGTLLEPMLPVVLSPPDRMERVPVTFVLVLDRSGSMEADRDAEISPIALTREAATRALETLRPDDFFGVLSFSGTTHWDVDIQQLENSVNLRLAQDAVSQMNAAGGTLMYKALEEALREISEGDTTEHLHILLMSDGVSGDGSLDEFRSLVTISSWRGVTISTIALGTESDPETLSLVASEGHGRYYRVLNASDLPNVMISETKAVQSENVQKGITNMVLGIDDHPAMSKIRLDLLPELDSYIALQSKTSLGAEDILVSGNFGDPLLSTWQYGLGHVSVWMGDIGEDWLRGVDDWEQQGEFWMQLFKYTLPNPAFGKTEVAIAPNNQALAVILTFIDEEDSAGLDSSPRFIFRVNEDLVSYNMTKAASQRYVVQIPLPQAGAYQGTIQYAINGEEAERLVPIMVRYPSEWRFADPKYKESEYARFRQNLSASPLTIEEELANSASFETKEKFDWYYPVVFLVLLSWPAEIAIRRWQMPWRRP